MNEKASPNSNPSQNLASCSNEPADVALRQALHQLEAPLTRGQRLLAAIERLPTWQVVAGCLLSTTVVAVVDHFTPDRFPVMIFYLPIITLICWLVNVRAAVALSLVCSVLWLVDDLLIGGRPLPGWSHYWISVVHFTFFVVVASVLWRLREAYERAQAASTVDALTGLANSRAFLTRCQRQSEECGETGQPLSVAMLDCDNFKSVNDQLGHLAGDHLLQVAAQSMQAAVRPEDLVARLGGDEFALLMPCTTQAQAEAIVECLRVEVDDSLLNRGWPVTLSAGVVTFARPPESVDVLIREADRLMYETKRSRKGSVRYALVG
jgi:diguanylate cyclase (GGDEF)-like protein